MNTSIYWSILAGICTVLGALLLFVREHWSKKSLAFFLGLASGVMIAVVLFDLLPSALLFPGKTKAIIGLLLAIPVMKTIDGKILKKTRLVPSLWRRRNRGCTYTITLKKPILSDSIQKTRGQKSLISLGYLIMLGIAMHDLPEGMAIAFGDELKGRTGFIIAMGIGIHNIPEGMAMAAPLLMGGVKKYKVLFRTFLVGLITPLGTIIGKYSAAFFPELLPLMLGLASGIMIYLVVLQLWPQAKINDSRSRWWGLSLGIIIIFAATYLV